LSIHRSDNSSDLRRELQSAVIAHLIAPRVLAASNPD